MKRNEENDLFLKRAITLAIPAMGQRMLTTLVNMIDTMMIGGIGETAISAVAIVNKVFFVYQLVIFGLSNGISIYISQYAGAGKKEKTCSLYNLGIYLCTLVALIATGIMLVFPDFLLGLFAKNPDLLALGKEYLFVIVFTLIPFAWSNAIGVTCRVLNASRLPFYASILSCLVNIVLNEVLIYGLFGFKAMGVVGAALATLIARLAEMIFLLITAGRSIPEARLRLKLDLDKQTCFDVVTKALPLMGNELIWSVGLNLVFINYSAIAEECIPALTVADNIKNCISVAFNGLAVATGILIGELLGANRLDEAKQKANLIMRISFIPFVLGSVVLYCIHPIAPAWFNLSADSYVVAKSLILIQTVTAWTQGYSNNVYYILRSGGDMKSVLMIDGLFTWYGPVLFSLLCARILHLSLLWTYLITEGTGFLKVLIATYFYHRGKWLNNLTDNSSLEV